MAGLSFRGAHLSYGRCDGYVESCVAVERCGADLDFGDLSVKGARHQGLAETLDAVYLALDAASAVVSAPSLPQGAPQNIVRH